MSTRNPPVSNPGAGWPSTTGKPSGGGRSNGTPKGGISKGR